MTRRTVQAASHATRVAPRPGDSYARGRDRSAHRERRLRGRRTASGNPVRAGVDPGLARRALVRAAAAHRIPRRLAAHRPARPVDRPALAALEAAWAAVTAPEPQALLAFLGGATPPLRPAFERLLHRFPDEATGLSRWDAQLLAHVDPQGTETIPV